MWNVWGIARLGDRRTFSLKCRLCFGFGRMNEQSAPVLQKPVPPVQDTGEYVVDVSLQEVPAVILA